MKMKQRLFAILTVVAVLFSTPVVMASPQTIKQGDYILLGRYEDDPILWKCINTQDKNGTLMLSDKVLTFKAFDAGNADENSKHWRDGYSFWEESTLRTWLNSTEKGGNITWPGNNPPSGDSGRFQLKNPYDQEDGFLSERNFSPSERSVMKSVSQWQLLTESTVSLAENGIQRCWQVDYIPTSTITKASHKKDVSQLAEVNSESYAMYRLSDTMFLLDEAQIYAMWQTFGTVEAQATDKAFTNFYNSFGDNTISYWLRSPFGDVSANIVNQDSNYSSEMINYDFINIGVRPAFYLNEDNIVILSGSGTEADPYIVDGSGQNGVAVFSQGSELQLDQPPVEENDRLLVPMRAVFESLGATVDWNDEGQAIAAYKDDTTIWLQIDNPELSKNTGEVMALDVPPRLIGERTMVPLRAVSEALGAKVTWIDELQRVVIDKPVVTDNFKNTDWYSKWKFREEYLERSRQQAEQQRQEEQENN